MKVSFEEPEYTTNADALGPLRLLEAIRIAGLEKKTPFYSYYVVHRERALVHSGYKSRTGTRSLHPAAIKAAVKVTKPSEPSV